ncbi:MAG: hypothetical protein ACK5Q5_17755 [Planctomycetaceae bacterium]
MSEQLLLTLAVAVSALACLLICVIFAYREGKRIGTHTRSERFNQLPSVLRLNGTDWVVCFTEYGEGARRDRRGWMRFRQYDSRVIGQGEDDEGRNWTAEGVVYGDKLCYITLDTDGQGRSLGTVMVDLREQSGTLEGMRCVWSSTQNAVTVYPIRLESLDATPSEVSRSSDREVLLSGNAR